MNQRLHITLITASVLTALGILATASASTVYYTTDFNGPNYQPNNSLPADNYLTTQDNWYNPAATSSPFSTAIVANGGANSLYIGGWALSNATAPISPYTYAIQGVNVQSNSVRFDTIFQINQGNGLKDNFGWTLFNTNGAQLLSIDLNSVSTNQFALGVTSYGVSGTSSAFNNNGSSLTNLNVSTSYHLGFSIYDIGLGSQKVDAYSYNRGPTGDPTYLASASLNGSFSNTTVGLIGATWLLTDTSTDGSGRYTGYGNNFMAMNTLTVTSVPEPKTYVLFGIAGLIAVIALRRKSNT
ncbi:MAG: PEP-CTERM sorting domain-containing protein [Verrucomicrobiota bacterium]